MTKKKKKRTVETAEADNLKRIKRTAPPRTQSRFDESEFHRMLAEACRQNNGHSDPSRKKR